MSIDSPLTELAEAISDDDPEFVEDYAEIVEKRMQNWSHRAVEIRERLRREIVLELKQRLVLKRKGIY